jgi:hypothetical protein
VNDENDEKKNEKKDGRSIDPVHARKSRTSGCGLCR